MSTDSPVAMQRSDPRPDSRWAWRVAAGVSASSGAIFGLGLARFLFELDPRQFGTFGTWPGALLIAAGSLAAALALSLTTRRSNAPSSYARWAPLALALPVFSLLASDVYPLRSLTLLLGAPVVLLLLLLAAPTPPLSQPNASQTPAVSAAASTPGRLLVGILPIALFVFLFGLYLRTLAPAVGQADTFEFQIGVARLGIAHGSGYPLLMLMGRLFSLLPVGGTLAFRANLSSAFFAGLAAVGVERLARLLGASPLVAVVAGLAFGVSPTLWSRAVEIEVFALNAAFVAAILYLCFDLVLRRPLAQPASMPPARFSGVQLRLMLLAFLFGLSLTNHLTTLFLGPACLLAVVMAIRREFHSTPAASMSRASPGSAAHDVNLALRPWSSVLRHSSFVLLALLLGLSVYLYLPIRWPAVNHGEALSLAGFANILTGNEARGAFNWRLPFQDASRYGIVWNKIAGEYGWPGLGLAALGLLGLLWPRIPAADTHSPSSPYYSPGHPVSNYQLRFANYHLPLTNYLVSVLLLLTSLGYFCFELAFNVPDPSFSSYIIPLHLITAVLMALGVQWLLDLIGPVLHFLAPVHVWSSLLPPAYCLLLTAFCLLPLRSLWRTFPLVDESGHWSAERLGELMLSQPLTHGAAILADSEKIAPLDYLQIAEGRRPDLDIIVLPDEASYRAALDERLGAGQVVYLGRYLPGLGSAYSLRSVGPLAEVSPVPFTHSTVTPRPAQAQPAAGSISLAGYALPGGTDTFAAAPPGELDVTLIWQARSAPTDNLLVNLRLADALGQAAWQNTGSVPVSGLYPTNAWRAGELVSDFYRLPVAPSLAPGTYQLQVALLPPFASAPGAAWTAVAPVTILPPARPTAPPHPLRAQFGHNWLLGYDLPDAVAPGSRFALTLYWLRTADSDTVAALGETRSLAAWPVDAVVPLVYHLIAPATGDHLDIAVNGGVPARCGWLAPLTGACALPAVKLSGQAAAEGAVNFDNQILLNRATLDTVSAAPGGEVRMTLDWQALRTIGADYTVFVHLLGPDGLVHGQLDRWPVSGTRATSGWTPGEPIADPYAVPLPPDAPPGDYHVEIGLYLLATGQRLPVLNADGLPVDDRLLLSGLHVRAP